MVGTEHTEHIHCCICGRCMDVSIPIIIDMVLDSRQDNADLIGMACEDCL